MAHDEYVYMIRFSPDGRTMLTAAGDNVACVWDWSLQKLLHTLEHDSAVYAAEFSPVGEILATGSGDGNVTLWKRSSGKQVSQQQDHVDAVYCLSFSPDGKQLASIGGDGRKGDTQCRVWSVPSLKIVSILPPHERPGYGVLFGPPAGPARNMLVTTGGDKLVHIYPRPTGKRKTLTGHTSDVYRCCFSPNGKQLATTSQDGSIRLWDVATGKLSKTLFQAKDPTYDVAYSPAGQFLVAVGDDGFVRFWNTLTHDLVAETKAAPEGLYSVAFTPDEKHVITGGVRGKLHKIAVPIVAKASDVGQPNGGNVER